MTNMKNLAEQVKNLEKQLIACTSCGICQSVCPLFEQTHKESDVARGKLALLDGLMNNFFDNPDGVSRHLNKCLLCGSCAANCPSGVSAVEIFVSARVILAEYKGFSNVNKLIFKKILANPKLFDQISRWLEKVQKLFIKPENNAQNTSCARFVSPLIQTRHIVPLAEKPFNASGCQKRILAEKSGLTIVFFTGCLIDKIFPSVARSAFKIFKHHGVGLICPENQGCCGMPALASGDGQSFQNLVDHNLKLLKGQHFDYLVTACATCTSTIKKLWPILYQGKGRGDKAFALEIADKTLDISSFLVNNAELDKMKTQSPYVRVTYHDPCHLKKSLGVTKEPRELIRIAGFEQVEMNNADKCCGMGGSFNLYHYDISSSIGKLKVKNIQDTNCSVVATGCPACMMQISDMLAQAHSKVRVLHTIEIYANAL